MDMRQHMEPRSKTIPCLGVCSVYRSHVTVTDHRVLTSRLIFRLLLLHLQFCTRSRLYPLGYGLSYGEDMRKRDRFNFRQTSKRRKVREAHERWMRRLCGDEGDESV